LQWNHFNDFEDKYKGKVFIVFSMKEKNKKVIKNETVIGEIENEIKRLEDLNKMLIE